MGLSSPIAFVSHLFLLFQSSKSDEVLSVECDVVVASRSVGLHLSGHLWVKLLSLVLKFKSLTILARQVLVDVTVSNHNNNTICDVCLFCALHTLCDCASVQQRFDEGELMTAAYRCVGLYWLCGDWYKPGNVSLTWRDVSVRACVRWMTGGRSVSGRVSAWLAAPM